MDVTPLSPTKLNELISIQGPDGNDLYNTLGNIKFFFDNFT